MITPALTYKYHSSFPVLRKYLDCSLPNDNEWNNNILLENVRLKGKEQFNDYL